MRLHDRRSLLRSPLPLCLAAFLLGLQDAWGQDLQGAVDEASGKFKKLIKTGATIAAVVIVVIGMMTTGFRFTQKDPSAIWYLAGTAAGGVLFGVAAAML